ncbi:MAG TPA: MaoC/PaaZ C-terminal domain-containing protein [Alphaproteobacteria bacterium]|jgi:acyl dehydratase|nr:MaoC/PaaZ C-terminal domain-containing protein [Alphaproteobacteria bacterium]|tara:strand:+ start:129 stop:599 length:471 start_codon:yes stop_codon:yes gene_type:complete
MRENPPFMDLVHFEDFVMGERYVYGAYEMKLAEMIAFAEQFDPEPFHLDADAAKNLGWPDLIASGPQVCAAWRRMSKDAFIAADAFVSPGWDNIRWLKPVVVGHILSVQSEVAVLRPLKSRPNLGYVEFNNEIRNQHGELTTTLTTKWMVYRRNTE